MTLAASRSERRAGFLLVEVLATLAISAAILAALVSTLSLVLRASDRTAGRVQELERQTRSLAALRRDIQKFARARWSAEGPRSFVFVGQPDRLVFAIDLRAPGALDAAAVVTVQSVGSEAGGSLLRAEADLPPGATSVDELRFGPARTIYEGRSLVRFAYAARLENGSEALLDTWPSPSALPSAIRIGLVDPSSGALLSAVRVPILVDAEPGCAAAENSTEAVFCSRSPPKPAEDERTRSDGTRPSR